MAEKWWEDPQYSHGYLVPLFAGYLLWQRRQMCPQISQAAGNAWGLLLMLSALALRLGAAYLCFDWLDAISLLPLLAGIAVLFGGWPCLRWSWPAIAFLAFMVPLPYRVEVALAHPLQNLATKCSTFALQTLGFSALADGNVILMNDGKLGVEQACSGLSMLLIFFALSTAVACVIQRPLLDKVIIVLSAIPIAVVTNCARIVVTGILQETAGHEIAEAVFHDLAGWLMMPLALGLLWLELWILGRLLVEQKTSRPLPIALGTPKPEPSRQAGGSRQPAVGSRK
jgi:exosortase